MGGRDSKRPARRRVFDLGYCGYRCVGSLAARVASWRGVSTPVVTGRMLAEVGGVFGIEEVEGVAEE